jgi:hypothetical protein
MDAASQWGATKEAYDFRTPGFAIDLCIMRRLRNVRVIVESEIPGEDVVFEVSGSQMEELRGKVKENRKLRKRQQVLKAELQGIRDGQKEFKKQIPFVGRRPVAAD